MFTEGSYYPWGEYERQSWGAPANTRLQLLSRLPFQRWQDTHSPLLKPGTLLLTAKLADQQVTHGRRGSTKVERVRPDEGCYLLDAIIELITCDSRTSLKKKRIRQLEGVTPPLALQQAEAPLQAEASLLTTISTSTIITQMSISRAFLCPEYFLSHLFLWEKIQSIRETHVLNVTGNGETKKRFWTILLDFTVPILWSPI